MKKLSGLLASFRLSFYNLSRFLSLYGKDLLFFSIVGLLVYLPAFLMDFGVHNDYYFRGGIDRGNFWMGFEESPALARMGRLLNAVIISIQFQLIDSISDLAIARFYAFIAALIACLALAYILIVHIKIKPLFSFLISLCILALPGFQIYILWVTNFSNIFSFLLGIAAYLIWDQLRLDSFSNKLSRQLIHIIAAQIILLASFMTYPANTFSFLLPTVARVLFQAFQEKNARRIILTDIVFIIMGAVNYYISFKYIIAPLLTHINPDYWGRIFSFKEGHYSFNVTLNLLEKLLTFIRLSKIALAGSWHVIFEDRASLPVFVIIMAGLAFVFYKRVAWLRNKTNLIILIQMMALICFLILAVNVPYIAVEDVPSAYRITLVYGALIIIIEFWLIEQIGKLLAATRLKKIPGIIAVVLVVLVVLVTGRNVLNASMDKNIELNYLRAELGSEDLSQYSAITVVGGPMLSSHINRRLTLDFKIACSQMFYMYCNSQLLEVLDELGYRKTLPIRYIGFAPDNTIKSFPVIIDDNDNSLIIDFNKARVAKTADWSMPAMQARTQRSSRAFYEGYFGKLDDNRLSEWDKQYLVKRANIVKVTRHSDPSGYPKWIRYVYQQQERKPAYSMSIDENLTVEEMPKSWMLFGSNNGVDWVLLDKKILKNRWQKGEMKNYTLEGEKSYKMFLFRFPEDNGARLNLAGIKVFF